ncbi:sensor histidine kinase [Lachnospiraceae bacterium KM106-2]|nr:sensor histidine kinase [Lachnospiraceae bacterium KM106-2]
MKFWKRIFLSSVGLFFVLYCTSGVILIEKIHLENLNNAINRSIDKYTDLENKLYLNIDYWVGTNFRDYSNVKNWMGIILNGYSTTGRDDDFYVEVYSKSGQLIMSNSELEIKGPRKEIKFASEKEKSFLIRKVDGKRYVFVSSIISLDDQEIKIVTISKIEMIYKSRIRNYQFFVSIGIAMMSLLAICMYWISKKLTVPIVRLSDASMAIRKGDYRRRVVESNGYDEVGILEKNFNQMLDVVNSKVAELEYANEAKQRFIDSLNHEIKTPITSIIGYSDLLLKSKVSEEIRIKALKYINQEAKRLEFLNATLLRLIVFREEADKEEGFEIENCILSALDTLKYKVEQKSICMKTELEESEICGDSKQFEVLIVNILDNAIKASRSGSEIEVKGVVKRGINQYQLKIRDYGIGIPKEEINKIIEPFYMVDKSRARKNNGVGLGLTICHTICEKYNIDMKLQSELGEGTEVTLTFPLEK